MSDFNTEIMIGEFEAQARSAMSPRYIPHQPFLRQRMFLGLTCEEALYGGQAYGGKDLDLHTPLATSTGWTTMGDIRVGEQVMDDQGNPCSVVWASEVLHNECYRVCFDDGSEIVAGADHQWLTSSLRERFRSWGCTEERRARRRASRPRRGKGKRLDLALRNSREAKAINPPTESIKTTREIAETLMKGPRFNHAVRIAEPLQLPEADLLIDPYVLGAWLGDGTSLASAIAGIDEEVFQCVANAGYVVTRHAKQITRGVLGLQPQLKRLGVYGNKHIPVAYLRASYEQRLAVLQGLCDTDGHATKNGQTEITLTRKVLIEGVHELCLSLGIKCAVTEGKAYLNGRYISQKYKIKFNSGQPVFRLSRKLIRQKQSGFRGNHKQRYITAVIPIESVPTRCIQVDSSSHCYLAGRTMIPTHNSDTLLMGALSYVDVPGYAALLLRRTFKDLSLPGALMERATEWLKPTPAHWSGETKTWTFPSAATLTFGYLDAENDKYQYQSSEFQYIGFDELTQFTDTQYTYLFSRLRRPRMPCVLCGGPLEMRATDGIWQHDENELRDSPEHTPEPDTIILRQYPASKERNLSIFQIPLQMRSGTNPGGVGADWVSNRFIPDGFTPKDAIEPKVWEKDAAIENPETREIEYAHTWFVPSRKEDNPYADTTTYNRSLSKLGLVERKQLGEGDWTITATGRMYFDPEAVAKFEPVRGTVGELFMELAPNGQLIPMFRPQRNGILEMWKRPQPGHFYSIGADTAEGKDVNKGEGTAKGDWTVDQVRDLESGEQVARLRARISERAHAEQLNMLARWYNYSFVVPETAGGYGRAMLDHLVLNLLYPIGHVYRRQGGRKQSSQTTPQLDELGFVTGRTTKPSLISGLNSAMLFHTIETYDGVTINEYKSFEQNTEGGASARAGCFDDCVIADALSVLGIAKFPAILRHQAAKKRPQIVRYAVGGGIVPMGERARAEEEKRRQRERLERM